MIGGDHVEVPSPSACQSFSLIFALADGWSALELGGSVGNFLGGERQVVRASFRSDGKFIHMGLAQQRQRIGGRNVHDVNVRWNSRAQAISRAMASFSASRGPGCEPCGMLSG